MIEERLKNGEVIYLVDQWAILLSFEDGAFVTRGIEHNALQLAVAEGRTPDYETENKHKTLEEALLSCLDHRWLGSVPGH